MINLHASHSRQVAPSNQTYQHQINRSANAEKNEIDLKLVQQLAARDPEVRSHEQAHIAAAGGLAHSGPSYQFTRGPDGRQYATSGEVNIDVAPVAGNPEATLAKAQKITRAALAPTKPSQADRQIAARASAMALQARAELQQQASKENNVSVAHTVHTHDSNKPYEQSLEVKASTIDIVV